MENSTPDPRMVALGQGIRQQREAQKLSQDRLAKMINTNQAYICRIEKAQVNPGFSTLLQIADALGISLTDLLEP